MPSIAREITSFSQKKEIDYIFKHARTKIRSCGIRILSAPAQKDFGRILVVTPRKSGNSPERHKMKRRLKEIFYCEKLYEKKLDLVIIVRKEGINNSFHKLRELLSFAVQPKID